MPGEASHLAPSLRLTPQTRSRARLSGYLATRDPGSGRAPPGYFLKESAISLRCFVVARSPDKAPNAFALTPARGSDFSAALSLLQINR